MSKVRASWIRNELKDRYDLQVEYKNIAKKCTELSVPFKEHGTMGIHFNSVIEKKDAEKVVSAYKKGGAKPAAPKAKPAAPKAKPAAPAPAAKAPEKQQPAKPTQPTKQTTSASYSQSPTQSQHSRPATQNKYSNNRSGDQNRSSGGYNQNRSSGGYNQNRPSGGYNQNSSSGDRPSGGYNQNRPSGGYNQNRPSGGYNQNRPSGGYNQNRPSGGYNQNRPSGGYNQNRPSGDRPSGGYNQNRPSGGYNQNRPSGDRPSGGYNQNRPSGDRPSGGYNQNRPSGGYNQNRSSGDRPSGGYNQNRPSGGYNQNRPSGDRPSGGYNQNRPSGDRPSGGYNQSRPSGGQGRPSGGYNQRPNSGNSRPGAPRTGAPSRPGSPRPGGGPNRGPNFNNRRQRPNPRASKARQRRRRERKQEAELAVIESQLSPEEKIVELRANMTVKDLAENMKISPGEVIKVLFMKGMATTINHALELETSEMIAKELEYEVILQTESEIKEEEKAKEEKVIVPLNIKKKIRALEEDESPEKLKQRPPVITIMGHVDHGKTSLLDYIRNARVSDGEVGGITQKIGAYLVNVQDKPLVFIDTPGHEAFTSMRARGASITDIVIVVIAADDGIMPQTIEAINHARASNVEIIVAVNKIDKPGADLERAKQQLTEYELVPEEWGGDTVIIPLSAKTGEGVDELLDMLLLVSEVLELKANPDKPALGVVIESKLDKGRGSVGTVLVQTGTLKQGDSFVVGPVHGRVRAMVDERGKQVKEASPSIPVEIIGFQEVPSAGEILRVVKNDKIAKSLASDNQDAIAEELLEGGSKVNLNTLYENIQDGKMKDLNLVIKGDIQGSLDAIKQSLERLSDDQVRVRIIHAATGEVTENDIMLASASDALIIAFNVKIDKKGKMIAQKEHIEVRSYEIIYKLIEDIQMAMEGLLEPELEEVEIGVAEVRTIFKISKSGTIAGSYMLEGRSERSAKVRVRRGDEIVHTGKLSSLKRFKDDVKEVAAGYECGIALHGYNDLAEGDRLEFFLIEAKQGSLRS